MKWCNSRTMTLKVTDRTAREEISVVGDCTFGSIAVRFMQDLYRKLGTGTSVRIGIRSVRTGKTAWTYVSVSAKESDCMPYLCDGIEKVMDNPSLLTLLFAGVHGKVYVAKSLEFTDAHSTDQAGGQEFSSEASDSLETGSSDGGYSDAGLRNSF